MGFEVGRHQLLDLVRVLGAQRDQAPVVAQELDRVMVGDEMREGTEQLAPVGILEMRLERQQAFAAGELEHREQEGQKLEIGGLRIGRAAEQHLDVPEHAQLHGGRIGDDEGAGRRARDDQHLQRLPEHPELAVRQVTTQHRSDDDQEAKDEQHEASEQQRRIPTPRRGNDCS
jgi:hypothetical protein